MEKKNLKALLISISLHIILIVGLVLGDFTSETKPLKSIVTPMKPIEAVVIDADKLQKAINKIKKQKADKNIAEKKRLRDIEKRVSDAKKRRTKEEAKIKRLEKQRKQKEQEKKRADKAAKEAKESKAKAAKAEKIRKQKEQEKQKADEAAAKARSKRIKEEIAAKKAETLRKKKIADNKRKALEEKERAIQEKLLAQQIAAEMATRNSARQQQLMSEVERYGALITRVINQNMINDRSTMEGKSCKLRISLAPSGFVTQVTIVSGDAVVCNAAERAVFKASTLPVSKDPDVFKKMRSIGVTVIPEF